MNTQGPAMTDKPMIDAEALLQRALPFLYDDAAKYEDDGSNEPLELAREIESSLASLPSDESALSPANLAFDGGREAATNEAAAVETCRHFLQDMGGGIKKCLRCNKRVEDTPAGATAEERWDVTSLLRITKTAIEVCNELSRPAMAEDLESVQHYLASALAQQTQSLLSQDSAAVSNAARQPAWGGEVDAERYRKLRSIRVNPYAVLPVGAELDAYVDALAQPRTEPPAAAYGRVVNGKAITVSVERNPANDEPLYAGTPHRTEQPPVEVLNLLAVIHRDGGHHTDAHGLAKSAADAENVVQEMRKVAAERSGGVEKALAYFAEVLPPRAMNADTAPGVTLSSLAVEQMHIRFGFLIAALTPEKE